MPFEQAMPGASFHAKLHDADTVYIMGRHQLDRTISWSNGYRHLEQQVATALIRQALQLKDSIVLQHALRQYFGSTSKSHGLLVHAGMLEGASQNPGPSPTGVPQRGLLDFPHHPPLTPSPKPAPRPASSPRGLCRPALMLLRPSLSPRLMPHALPGPLERPPLRYKACWIDSRLEGKVDVCNSRLL